MASAAGWSVERAGWGAEGADHPQPVKVRSVLEVLGQQVLAARDARRGYDQRVPAGKPEAVLDQPARLQHLGTDGHRPPGEQVADVGTGYFGAQAWLELAGGGRVVLLEDLEAEPRRSGSPQVFDPRQGLWLLVGL